MQLKRKREPPLLLVRLRQAVCRHNWRQSNFQALVGYSISYKCTKCGKWQHV